MCLGGHVAWCRLSARRTASPGAPDEASEAAEPAESTEPTEAAEPAPAAPAEDKRRATPSRSAPLTLMLRRDVAWLRAPAALRDDARAAADPLAELSPAAQAVAARLAASGASFLADLVTATALAPDEVEDALWELVGAGLASADGFASLRVLVDRRRGETRSHFDPRRTIPPTTAIANTNASAAPPRSWADAVKRARSRDHRRPAHALRALPTAAGRWSLLGAPDAAAVDAEASARQLLHRYGVVFRDLVQRETNLPPWRDLAIALRRLEARGEIRGGRFVTGMVGEQFALAEAADALRAARRPPHAPELVRVAACDPLNLVGILAPGPRVPAVVGNAVLYKDGVAIASLEAGEVVVRERLEPGARVDGELVYHAPPRLEEPAPQATLPL
jgi:ATP-dependent Lhr-like helicase